MDVSVAKTTMINKFKLLFFIFNHYLVAILLTSLLFFTIYNPTKFNIKLPYSYNSDSLFSLTVIKTIKDTGWYFENKYLGTPFISNLYDYPITDTLSLFSLKILVNLTRNIFLSQNIFYFLTFIITVVSSVFVFCRFGISKVMSILSSLLFTLSPYHFFRNEVHLLLSFYSLIPPITLISYWISRNGKLSKLRIFFSIFVASLISFSGIYYALFSCIFLTFSGVYSFLKNNKRNHLLISLFLILLIFMGLLTSTLPNILYQIKHGTNTLTAKRNPIETEYYGLRIIQMFIPQNDFKIDILKKIKNQYYQNGIGQTNRGEAKEYLGVIPLIGFVLLLLYTLFIKTKNNIFSFLSRLNIFILLVSTISGFGTIFAYYISPQIRALGRVSIFISFISLLAITLFIKRIYSNSQHKNTLLAVIIIISIFGITEQIGNYQKTSTLASNSFKSDQEFINKVENLLPSNSMVFQLPYKQFPESPPIYNLTDYDLLKPYLHSKTIKWSYGAVKGRYPDQWYSYTANLTPEILLNNLSLIGFKGILIDRAAYVDNGINVESKIKLLLKTSPIISLDQRLVFYSLNNNQVLQNTNKTSLYPIIPIWESGFYGFETQNNNIWQWSQKTSKLSIDNFSDKDKKINITLKIEANSIDQSAIKISSDFFNDTIVASNSATGYSKQFIIPKGKHTITFSTNSTNLKIPNDPREMYFRLINFQITEL